MNFSVWIYFIVIVKYKYKALEVIDIELNGNCNIRQTEDYRMGYINKGIWLQIGSNAVLEDCFLLLKFSSNEYHQPKNIVYQHIYPKKNVHLLVSQQATTPYSKSGQCMDLMSHYKLHLLISKYLSEKSTLHVITHA